MRDTRPSQPVSLEDYLAGECATDVRHEYIAGQVYAMVGASRSHALIVTALALAIGPYARKNGCQLFIADMKVRLSIAGDDIFYYPDLMLSCDPEDREDFFITRPCLIVEVLSKSTERIDRREKLLAYQTLGSLQEYVLTTQDHATIEIFRRTNNWQREQITGDNLHLDSIDTDIPLAMIYQDVGLAPAK